jgi:hypothetical protein
MTTRTCTPSFLYLLTCIDKSAFNLYYKPIVDVAISEGDSFIIGAHTEAGKFLISYLLTRVYHSRITVCVYHDDISKYEDLDVNIISKKWDSQFDVYDYMIRHSDYTIF